MADLDNKPVEDMSDEEFEQAFDAQFDEEEEEEVEEEEVDDESEEDEDEESDEDDSEEEESEEKPEEKEIESFLEVDFLGEHKALTKEEAKNFAQMGMNYPRMLEKLKAAEEHPLLGFAKELMADNGFEDVGEFLEAYKQSKVQEVIDSKVDELMAKGIDQELAERMAKLEFQQFENDKKANYESKLAQDEKQKQDSYIELFDWHQKTLGEPLDVEKISMETLDKIANGMKPKEAYLEQLATEKFQSIKTETEQKMLKHEEKVKKAPPSTNADPQIDDDVWSSEYIEEMAEKRGDSWVRKNFAKIEKSGYFK